MDHAAEVDITNQLVGHNVSLGVADYLKPLDMLFLLESSFLQHC